MMTSGGRRCFSESGLDNELVWHNSILDHSPGTLVGIRFYISRQKDRSV